jgi:tRNA threonylcarbamoyladenosine biosynthesis protein TsaB
MTIILAIETSTELASVSLMMNDLVIHRELSGVQTHSFGLLPAIQELLKEAEIELAQCDVLAFGCGPGAFTGVRTACGAVQGMAFGLDLSVLPIVSLQAMAEAARSKLHWQEVLCVLDARMDEVYWAHYKYIDDAWRQQVEPTLSDNETAFNHARSLNLKLVLGNGVNKPADFHSENCTSESPHARYSVVLAKVAWRQGLQLSAEQAQPLYLRNKVALTIKERAREKLLAQGV